jgi:predicted DNA-binding transcriptional regulator YafY
MGERGSKPQSGHRDDIAATRHNPGMDRYERILSLHRILKTARYPVTVPRLQDELGCSRATVYRDLAFLRDALMAPVVGDGEAGFRYDASEGDRFELPGLWLNSEELHALLATQQLLSRSGGGMLSSALAPLQQRIEKLLDEHANAKHANAKHGGGKRWPVERVRVIPHRTRRMDEQAFRAVCSSVLERKQLSFDYRARSTDEKTRRTVSPQRITHYRDNWYLDAWDHDREALRSFSVDRISGARVLDSDARDIDEAQLNEHLSGSYGIFSGAPKGWATIVFSAKSARWVADEHWHSQQQGRFLPDGRYELKVPYSSARELLMDVLHYGSDAEVVEPPALREQARSLLSLALSHYDR